MTDFDSPLIKYFSFIALGLMLTIGYVVLRALQSKKKHEHDKPAAAAYLAEAELEARRLKARRDVEKNAEGEAVLSLTPGQQRERERVKRLVENHDRAEKNDSGEPETPGPEKKERQEKGEEA